MRRVFDFGKRAVQRVNARIAILIAVVAVGGIAAWQGVTHFPRAAAKPDGPTKQIATGVEPANAAYLSLVQPAVASLTDAQLPAASSDARRLLGYGQPAESQSPAPAGLVPPPTSPYAAATSESAGGYAANGSANSGYGVAAAPYGQPAETTQPSAAPPTDPSAAPVPVAAIPENPYRSGSGSGSPTYGESTPSVTSAADLAPVTSSAAAISNRSSRATASFSDTSNASAPAQPPSEPAAMAPPPAAIAPPNTLPNANLSASPSASAASASQIGLSPLRTNTPQPSAFADGVGSSHLAANKPGDRQLEGPQQPTLLLEKVSPAEIQVGKAATFELYVRNAGRAPAQQVVVTDHVPAGTQLLDAKPAPQQGADGSLVWKLDVLQPGEEQHISLEIMPQTEGSIGSIAQVSFAAAATSRSLCTLPKLAIEQRAPAKVLIGDAISVEITVFNAGTGPATAVIVEEDVPDSLEHVAGPQLEYEIGTLRPQESKQIQLSLRAKKQGLVQNLIRAHGDGNLIAQHAVQIEIVAPLLQVNVNGPKTRYLERQATYALQIANPGTAAARNVELIARLPRGMKFVTTDSQGQYDPAQHAVFWSLAELAPAQAGQVKLTTLPVEPGEQRLQIEGRAEMGLTATGEQVVHVEQSAELMHTVKDSDEVIEVGSETTYEIRVTNTGTKAATNVQVAALMPEGMSAVEGLGPTSAPQNATQVVFEPLNRLNPQEEVIYKVRVKATQPGEKVVRVQLSSDEWKTPVTREESTRVYQDR